MQIECQRVHHESKHSLEAGNHVSYIAFMSANRSPGLLTISRKAIENKFQPDSQLNRQSNTQ